MNKKKILVLLSGQLRHFSEKNYKNLINNFRDYRLEFFITCWEGENKESKNIFSKIYKPIKLTHIKNQDFSSEVKNILVPDTAVNSENIFHMWYAFSESCKNINKLSFDDPPDYILRYRSDILPETKQNFKFDKVKEKNILIPDRYHWNGVNDQFFIINYKDLKYFVNIYLYLREYLEKKLLFSSELIFQRFIKKINFKINYIDYDYKIMRRVKKSKIKLKQYKITKIPIYERLTIKFNKLNFKIRNFKNFFIDKRKRNNQQDIII